MSTNQYFKKLAFKNKLTFIWNLIFNFDKTFLSIKTFSEKDLRKEYSDKLDFLMSEYDYKGISKLDNSVIVLSINSNEHPYNSLNETARFETKTISRNMIGVSYLDRHLPLDYLKSVAANNLAKHLIDNGFLKTHFSDNTIKFTITTY